MIGTDSGTDIQPGDRITVLTGKAISAHTRTALTNRFTIGVASIRPDGNDTIEVTGGLLRRRIMR